MTTLEFKADRDNKAVYLKIDLLTRDVQRGIRQAYYRLGRHLKAHLNQKMLEKPKHGRTYYFKKSRVTKMGPGFTVKRHIASSPSEYPANMTGAMRRSRDFKVSGHEQLEFGLNVPYAQWIEDGTKRMAARKPLQRSIEDTQGNAVAYFEQEIKGVLIKSG